MHELILNFLSWPSPFPPRCTISLQLNYAFPIQLAIANAKSLEEVEHLKNLLRAGQVPQPVNPMGTAAILSQLQNPSNGNGNARRCRRWNDPLDSFFLLFATGICTDASLFSVSSRFTGQRSAGEMTSSTLDRAKKKRQSFPSLMFSVINHFHFSLLLLLFNSSTLLSVLIILYIGHYVGRSVGTSIGCLKQLHFTEWSCIEILFALLPLANHTLLMPSCMRSCLLLHGSYLPHIHTFSFCLCAVQRESRRYFLWLSLRGLRLSVNVEACDK